MLSCVLCAVSVGRACSFQVQCRAFELRYPFNFDCCRDVQWSSGPEAAAHLAAWKQGRTGFPLVDAGGRRQGAFVCALGVLRARSVLVLLLLCTEGAETLFD